MTLQELASSIAAAPASDQNRDLALLPPLNAVIECARRAGAIDEDAYNALLRMDADQDFSFFVGPNDSLVKDRAELQSMPGGAFIAVIFVEDPRGKDQVGRRHLVLPMISLGGGKAAGLDSSQIGLGALHDGWTIVDLDDLHWLNDSQTNGYDTFNRFPVGIKKSQVLRLRYRMPARSSARNTAPGSPHLAWGTPEPSTTLRQQIVAAAGTMKRPMIEDGWDNSKKPPDEHVFRVGFRFELDHDAFETFFNSPNELRGHYYADSEQGDSYTRDLLQGIADTIDWEKSLAALGNDEIFGRPFSHVRGSTNGRIVELVKASVVAGKIWFNEKASVSSRADWHEDNNQQVAIKFAPNTRWIADQASASANWRAFLADTRADQGVIADDAFRVLDIKFNDLGLDHATTGSKYRYCTSAASLAGDDPNRLNMDIKGDWVKPDGSLAGFTPKGKHFRGYQIKWFGFT